MKIYRIVFWVLLVLILLTVGFIVWFCTGSFTYKSSMDRQTFVIDAPIDVVCERVKNIKIEPKTEDSVSAKIDIQEAAKSFSLGQPIEVEIDHPKLGTITAGIKINLEIESDALIVHGSLAYLDPRQFKKFGKTVVDIENLTFTIAVSAQDKTGKGLAGKEICSTALTKIVSESIKSALPDPFRRVLSARSELNSGKTVLELSFDPEVRVNFRGMGFMRFLVRKNIEKLQGEVVQKIETFLDENLRQPGEEELARQKAAEEKAQKGGSRWNFLNRGETQETVQESEPEEAASQEDADKKTKKSWKFWTRQKDEPNETASKSESEEETADLDDDPIDVSGLEDEI
ncbi:MAG: hypothetical protein K6C40_10645 [Thermoguttaceae bacterium]|nr:hypothetical protein [Thermoguttaceae bacterium]